MLHYDAGDCQSTCHSLVQRTHPLPFPPSLPPLLPSSIGRAPLLRRPHEHPLRQGPLQARPRPHRKYYPLPPSLHPSFQLVSLKPVFPSSLPPSPHFVMLTPPSLPPSLPPSPQNTAKNLIETVSRDYVRLLKYGDSLYRCKALKRAALGRMCTVIKVRWCALPPSLLPFLPPFLSNLYCQTVSF